MWLLLLVACIPIPHDQQRSPELHGTLVDASQQPIAGATAHLEANPTGTGCTPQHTTVTAADGSFVLPATKEREAAFGFGDRRDRWRVCIQMPDGSAVEWENEDYWGGPPTQTLVCDPAGCTP
jgi:hypothetical protein